MQVVRHPRYEQRVRRAAHSKVRGPWSLCFGGRLLDGACKFSSVRVVCLIKHSTTFSHSREYSHFFRLNGLIISGARTKIGTCPLEA